MNWIGLSVYAVLIILWIIGISLITYTISKKFFKNQKKSIRITLTVITAILSAAVVGLALLIATFAVFGR